MNTLNDQGKTYLIANGTTNNPKYGKRVTTCELITPEVAKEILATCTPNFQRDVSESHVLHFVNLMRQGEFGVSTIIFSRLPDTPRDARGTLLEGQHRLRAVVRSGLAVWFNIDTYELKSEKESGDLYACIDVYARQRSFAARFKAHGGGGEIAPGTLNNMKNTVDHLRNGLLIPHVTSYDLEDMETAVMEISDAYVFYNDLIAKVKKQDVRSALRRKCIATVAVATLKYATDKARAKEFWQNIVDRRFTGDEYDPITAMYDFLERSTSGHHGDARRVFTMDDAQTLVAISYWNSYMMGKRVTFNLAVDDASKFLDWMRELGVEYEKTNMVELVGVPLIFKKGSKPISKE